MVKVGDSYVISQQELQTLLEDAAEKGSDKALSKYTKPDVKLTQKEACEFLGIGEDTFRKRRKKYNVQPFSHRPLLFWQSEIINMK